ncbi:hypothetical protein TNCT6_12330 [Streptomyces sp. 6-11-2]|nr:hypothetical protein TNCT6_12330 [Streptomyces sp. 6-11-2]
MAQLLTEHSGAADPPPYRGLVQYEGDAGAPGPVEHPALPFHPQVHDPADPFGAQTARGEECLRVLAGLQMPGDDNGVVGVQGGGRTLVPQILGELRCDDAVGRSPVAASPGSGRLQPLPSALVFSHARWERSHDGGPEPAVPGGSHLAPGAAGLCDTAVRQRCRNWSVHDCTACADNDVNARAQESARVSAARACVPVRGLP